MMRGGLFISRPFGISLGLFILLNLILALKEPRLSANRAWLSVPLDEPWLSVFVSLLGLTLLVPHSWAEKNWIRLFLAGTFTGFLLLSASNVIGFYHEISLNQIQFHAKFPFSLVLSLIL